MEPNNLTTLFLEELLGPSAKYIPRNPDILLLASVLPAYHIDGVTIWRKKEWETEYKNILFKRAKEAEYKRILDLHHDAMNALMKSLSLFLGGKDMDQIRNIALTIIKERAVEAAKGFGVDISELPVLPLPCTFIERNREMYTIQ